MNPLQVDIWFIVAIGSTVTLTLVVGLVILLLVEQRGKSRLEREKRIALEANERRLQQLLQESQVMQEKLARLSQEIIRVQEEQQRRISRELHDEVGQLLTAVALGVENTKRIAPQNPTEAVKRISDLQPLVQEIQERIRVSLHELVPVSLEKLGLLPTMEHLASDFTRRTGIEVRVTTCDAGETLSHEQKLALYRIVQESLTNTAKHAKNATMVTINFSRSDDNTLIIEIHDNGNGFDVTRHGGMYKAACLDDEAHFGLLGMQERAKLAGGALSLASTRGMSSGNRKGTTIRVTIPLPETHVGGNQV